MRVFVYGTLRPGEANADLAQRFRPVARLAVLEGYTLMAGRGLGYPYAVSAAGSEVTGVVYSFASATAGEALARLDHLEGFLADEPHRSHYRRLTESVRLTDRSGQQVRAFVYVAGPLVEVSRLVPVGSDWSRRHRPVPAVS